MGAEHAADGTIAQQWCHNKFVLCIIWICAILLRTKIILWIKYVLRVDSALAIFSEEEEKEEN